MKNVHTEHCCWQHGCKYGDEDCPVVAGTELASGPCEQCRWEALRGVAGDSPASALGTATDAIRRALADAHDCAVDSDILDAAAVSLTALESALATALKDKERLDFLDLHPYDVWEQYGAWTFRGAMQYSIRDAIDASFARHPTSPEEQP